MRPRSRLAFRAYGRRSSPRLMTGHPNVSHLGACFASNATQLAPRSLNTLASVAAAATAGGIATRAVAEPSRKPGEKTLSEMRLVQLKGLHRSIFQQIASRRARRGAPGEKSLSKMRLVQLKGLHRSIFRQIPSQRFAQVDFPTDFLPRGRLTGPFFVGSDPRDLHRSIFRQVFCPGGVSRARFPTGWAGRRAGRRTRKATGVQESGQGDGLRR